MKYDGILYGFAIFNAACQRRRKNQPCGGARVSHLDIVYDGWDWVRGPAHALTKQQAGAGARWPDRAKPVRIALSLWAGFSPAALAEAVAVAIHFQDMNMVGQAIQQCPGQAFGTESFGPFVERQVAGDQCGAALVSL